MAPSLCAALLAAAQAGAAPPEPIRLALFGFELEDYSAGAAITGETPADRADLTSVTHEVADLLVRSGRYRLVDVAGVDAPAAKAHTLHECGGCDAGIARRLGADQSLVGVVKRVSRVEYTVRFQIRDARTGAVVSSVESSLCMGADDSWRRGAALLVKDRLLASADRP